MAQPTNVADGSRMAQHELVGSTRLPKRMTRKCRVEERRGCLGHAATLRFLSPLIEPDMQISSIRLSDKTSRLRPRLVVAKPAQTYESEVPV